MKNIKDNRITIKYILAKERLVLFLVMIIFNSFNIWIFKILDRRGFFLIEKDSFDMGLHVVVASVLATVIISLARYRSWIRPLQRLSRAARDIAKGDLSVRIAPMRKDGRKDFIEILFDDFNTMTRELAFVHDNLQNIVHEKTAKVVRLQNAVLKTMSSLTEYRDSITGGHIERTQKGVRILLEEIKKRELFADIVNEWDMPLIIQSAELHDVGKIAISDRILKKPGALSKEEYDEMKSHVMFGLNIIERIEADSGENDFLNHAKTFALTHHERWDGAGYPRGLRGEEIPLEGRIMAIADVYDALVSERPYKRAFTHEEAVKLIIAERGTQFDPTLTDLFEQTNERFR